MTEVICPSKYYYLKQSTHIKQLSESETIPVYVPKHEQTPDGKHKYCCFAITTTETSDFSELKEADRAWLERLGVQRVHKLAKIVCINENNIPLHFAAARITRVHDDYNAVGYLISPPNIISYEQFFKDRAIFIKTLDKMRLYFLGYYKPREGNPRLVRFYTPKTTTDRHYYHLQIIRALQARLPEAVYKKLRKALNLRISGEKLTFNMLYDGRVRDVKADFTVPTINVCVENFDELAKDPVNFLIACYAEMVKEGVVQ